MQRDTLSPCAADALWRVRQVTINGHPIGIMKLDECIAAVKAQELPGDDEITEALLKAVKAYNYIPPPVEAEYARALFEEYRKFSPKEPRQSTPP